MRTSRVVAATVTAILAGTLAGCTTPPTAESTGPVRMDFWYSASGVPADVLVSLVDEFNEAHTGEIEVRAIYQGSYNESIAKLTTAVNGGRLPGLIQGGDTFSTYLRDTGLTAPPATIRDWEGKTFDAEDLVPVVRNYYSFDDELSSYPIMISQAVVVYNKDLLAQAGIRETEAPTSVEELYGLARTAHDATGAGITMFTDPWWPEQFTASEGLAYCTPDNGTGTAPADGFQYTRPKQLAIWKTVQEAVASGVQPNTGVDGTASLNLFAAQQAAFMVQSTRIYGDVEKNASFDFGVWPLPVASDRGGSVPGGNSVWVVKEGKNDREMSAAATLAEFLASPESQKRIFTETGYLPTSRQALDSLSGSVSDVQQVMLDQFEKTTSSVPSAGCHSGAMGEARTKVLEALESIIGGSDVEASLKSAQDAGDAAIAAYNKRR
ncbi:extracellular solute-binding protein [Leifsonia aquatica]|uniref:extracellular solute-binding protein n=1 Tax=Leifsonia aquatica TaxID=144185 RepID=UPI00384FEE91